VPLFAPLLLLPDQRELLSVSMVRPFACPAGGAPEAFDWMTRPPAPEPCAAPASSPLLLRRLLEETEETAGLVILVNLDWLSEPRSGTVRTTAGSVLVTRGPAAARPGAAL